VASPASHPGGLAGCLDRCATGPADYLRSVDDLRVPAADNQAARNLRPWAPRHPYVAFVTDVFSHRIVGWQLAGHLRTDLPPDALETVVYRRRPHHNGLIHHSDSGSQYLSIRYFPHRRVLSRSRPGRPNVEIMTRASGAGSRTSAERTADRLLA